MKTPVRCPICDEGMELRDHRMGQYGVLFLICPDCPVLARAVPHVTRPYDPGVGFESLALMKKHESLVRGLAGLIANGGGSRPLSERDHVLIYGAQDMTLARLLDLGQVQVTGYEPRPEYWPAIKTVGGSNLLLKSILPSPGSSYTVLVGLDELWLEQPTEVLSWFNPELAVLSPPIHLGDTDETQFVAWGTKYLTTMRYAFTQKSFTAYLDVAFPRAAEVQFLETPEVGAIAIVQAAE
jgi:hypothetical protein